MDTVVHDVVQDDAVNTVDKPQMTPNCNVRASLPHYWPAYMLSDWRLERAGRLKPPPKQPLKDATASSVSKPSTPASSGVECIIEQQAFPTDKSNADEDANTPRTAGMVIIGDEILNGFTHEVNLQIASQRLLAIGIPLKMVTIVPDDISEIVDEVRRVSQKCDYVITSGGIGKCAVHAVFLYMHLMQSSCICI